MFPPFLKDYYLEKHKQKRQIITNIVLTNYFVMSFSLKFSKQKLLDVVN